MQTNQSIIQQKMSSIIQAIIFLLTQIQFSNEIYLYGTFYGAPNRTCVLNLFLTTRFDK